MMASDRKNEDHSSRRHTRGEELDTFLSEELSRRRNQSGPLPAPRSLRSRPRTGIILLIMILAGFLIVFSGSHLLPVLLAGPNCSVIPASTENPTGQRSIALIDQMGSQYPNPAFASNVSLTAKTAGFRFDYYPPRTITVDFFVNLPNHHYSIIILRTHGTGIIATDPAAIATSEDYSTSQHVADQFTDRVTSVDVNGTRYFALKPGFVSDAVCGGFSGTIIMAMYCEGAGVTSLARAFFERGSAAYIGWDGLVTVSHTDQAFESLVKLLVEGKPVGQSVQDVMMTPGPDPIYGSRLSSYSPSSLPPSDPTPLWEQYWYIISAGTAATIFGLAKIRNAPRTGARRRWRVAAR